MSSTERSKRNRCALCLQKRELRLSHIIPEFFYKALALYDDKHRFHAYSTDPDEGVAGPHQKGIRERLLCDECEGRLNPWETYARKVIFGGVPLDCAMDDHGDTLAEGVDYARFKLFSMSLLWRAGVSSLEQFDGVSLGVHEERLRQRLLAGDPGRYWEYGLTILYPPQSEAEQILSRTISQPERLKFKSHRFYRMSLGMTFWLFPVSNQMSKLETDEWLFSLFEHGRLIFYNGGASALAHVYRLAMEMGRADAERTARKK